MIGDQIQNAIQSEEHDDTPAIPRIPPLIALSNKIFNQRITVKFTRNNYKIKENHHYTSVTTIRSDYQLENKSKSINSDTENSPSENSYDSEEMPPRSKSPINMYTSNSPGSSESENRVLEEVWTCDFCPKTYTKWKRFTKHKKRHYTRQNFSCKHCDKVFTSRPSWDYHVKSKHTQQKEFVCHECSKGFVTKYHLQAHIKSHKYMCHFCHQSFTAKYKLNKHKEVHRNIKCELCPRAFFRQHRLKRHMELKHPDAQQQSIEEPVCQKEDEPKCQQEEEPVCELKQEPVCEEEEEQEASQEDDESSCEAMSPEPTEVMCQYCERIFPSMHDLKYHWKITGDNLFICVHCFEICDSELAFSHHLLKHSEEKIFTCTNCWKTFATMDLLEDHFSVHSGQSESIN
ncbi:hypothetical protein U1Q18_051315 [Sarracenia purpurea var. burkii]